MLRKWENGGKIREEDGEKKRVKTEPSLPPLPGSDIGGGQLKQVGCGSLAHGVCGLSLGSSALPAVGRVDLREISAPAQQGLYVSGETMKEMLKNDNNKKKEGMREQAKTTTRRQHREPAGFILPISENIKNTEKLK